MGTLGNASKVISQNFYPQLEIWKPRAPPKLEAGICIWRWSAFLGTFFLFGWGTKGERPNVEVPYTHKPTRAHTHTVGLAMRDCKVASAPHATTGPEKQDTMLTMHATSNHSPADSEDPNFQQGGFPRYMCLNKSQEENLSKMVGRK